LDINLAGRFNGLKIEKNKLRVRMYGAMTALAFVDESRRYPEMKPTSCTDVVAVK
jgi:hypothetical protein